MKTKDFKRICKSMHDICWIIAELEDTTDSQRNKLCKMAERFYRLKLQLSKFKSREGK